MTAALDILVFSRTTGFRHASIQCAVDAIEALCRKEGWTLTDSLPIDGAGAATWEFNLRPPETMPVFRFCRGTFALDGEGGASVSGTYVTMMGGGTPWSAVRGF